MAADSAGNVYIADEGNNRIRLLSPNRDVPSVTSVNGYIAAGEMVVLNGFGLGPEQLVSAQPGDDGSFGTQLAGTSVLFNGIEASLISTSATQAAVIVPLDISGVEAQIIVTYQSKMSAPFSVPVTDSARGSSRSILEARDKPRF